MNKELIEALEDLMDVQNGAPLITLEKYWNEAMEKAEKALQKAKQQPTKNAEEFLKNYNGRYYLRSEIINLLESYANQSKNEIQQRDLTIQELSEQLIESNQSKWISVEDRLPEDGNWYLVFERGQVNFLFLDSVQFWINGAGEEWMHKITHWQPLPQPPVNNDKQYEDEV